MSSPVCSLVATAINLANAKKLAKKLIRGILKDTEDGLLNKINQIKIAIDLKIIQLKGDLLAALPAGALSNIKGAISAISKVDDLQRAIKRGDVAGAAAIAGEIADDFPMLGDALDNLGDIDICKELPNLIKTDAGLIELSSNLKMPSDSGGLGLLKKVADKAKEFSESTASVLEEAEGRKQTTKDQMALVRAQRRNKLDITESTNEEVIDAIADAVG